MKEGWEIKKIKEIGTVVGGTTPDTKNPAYWNGENPWISPAELDGSRYLERSVRKITNKAVKDKGLKLQPKGTVILSSRAPIGKVAISKIDFYCNQGFKNIICGESMLNVFLYYWLRCNVDLLNSLGKGTTFKEISKSVVEGISIPVPPMDEQLRIVKILDDAFAKIDKLKANAQKNLANAKALFQATLKKELTPKPDWQTKKLGEISLGKLSYGASVPSKEYDGEYRYIRITDIDDDGFLLDEFVSPKEHDEKYILHYGDLLLARTGGTIGKSYLYTNQDGNCIYAGYLIRAILNQDIVLPEYIFYNTKTERYWNFIYTSQKAAAQPNINAKQYSGFEVSFPSLDEQKNIVQIIKEIFDKYKKLQLNCEKTIAECDALKQSILRKAFNGEL